MKLYCKVGSLCLCLCLGLLLLLYFFSGGDSQRQQRGQGRTPRGQGARGQPLALLRTQQQAPPRTKKQPPPPPPPPPPSKKAKAEGGGQRRGARGKGASLRRPKDQKLPTALIPSPQWMHLAVVACGDRLEETLIMLKSAVLFSNRKIKFHIFAEDSLKPEFERKLQEWPPSYTKKFECHVYPIAFSVGNAQEWKKLFKPCAAQRLFLPMILKDVDSLLYVDTDVLFLRPIDDIWRFLTAFNSTQLAAMAPEHEIPKIGWYSRFARHPYYGTTGVNSGVMLMNLTRIRNTQFKNSMIPTGLTWEEMLYPLYQKYKNYITWGDQDLLNIIFYFNPECLYLFPCQWNYRPDHCMYGSNCKGAEEEGISILHGNRGVYHDDKQPTFKALYEVIRDSTDFGRIPLK
ncbi:glucoside xylosyltransferase 2 isoform X2 [Sceloporus undulatus]|uniref:glucoside xylosyltransferase 2 isoform X2 n=1 Tax=Sceloporus undulatus TaxID=8520 RepID=UPI001C4B5F10|nr:glucoside xylosyltransferase 2 isoform X2 [Sceloporus undulatus]